jgi:hypothetical protein
VRAGSAGHVLRTTANPAPFPLFSLPHSLAFSLQYSPVPTLRIPVPPPPPPSSLGRYELVTEIHYGSECLPEPSGRDEDGDGAADLLTLMPALSLHKGWELLPNFDGCTRPFVGEAARGGCRVAAVQRNDVSNDGGGEGGAGEEGEGSTASKSLKNRFLGKPKTELASELKKAAQKGHQERVDLFKVRVARPCPHTPSARASSGGESSMTQTPS